MDLLFGWGNWFGKHSSDVWTLVPLCLMWTVWWEHNRRTIEDLDSFASFEFFASSLFEWSCVWSFTSTTSIADFIVIVFSPYCSFFVTI